MLSRGEVSGGLLVHPVPHCTGSHWDCPVCLGGGGSRAIVRVNKAGPSQAWAGSLPNLEVSQAVYGHYSASSASTALTPPTSQPGQNFLQLYGDFREKKIFTENFELVISIFEEKFDKLDSMKKIQCF